MKKSFNAALERGSDSVLTSAGIFKSPERGRKYAGVSKNGENVYISIQLANSSDIRAGFVYVHTLAAFVTPFQVFKPKEKEHTLHLAEISGNQKFIGTLDRLQDERKGETFAATLLKGVKADTRHALGVVAAVKLYDHWGVISPAQKSIAIAILGVQTHRTDERGPVCDLKIIDGPDGQLFQVKDALELFSMGKNPFLLARYWDQLRMLNAVYGGKPTPQALSDFAESHGLIGPGIQGGAVPGVSKRLIQKNGAVPVPQYGVGALSVSAQKNPPQGYAVATQMGGKNLIVPKANAQSAMGAMQNSLLGSKSGSNGVSANSVSTYKKWHKSDSTVKDKGAEGGSHFVGALAALRQSSPHLFNALVAFITKNVHTEIKSSDPLEYAASLSGIALAIIVTGKRSSEFDKQGLDLTLKSMESNPANFSKLQILLRGLYARFGISSKADAFQLSNQAFAEERINESDLVAVHEIFSVIYDDDGYAKATRLMSGKDKGLSIVANPPPDAKNSMLDSKTSLKAIDLMTKEELRDQNVKKYLGSSPGAKSPSSSPSPDTETQPVEPPAGSEAPAESEAPPEAENNVSEGAASGV